MNANRKSISALALVSLLSLSFAALMPTLAYGSDGGEGGWKTAHMVGKFLNSEPLKPDQIFKIQYGAANIPTAEQLAECSRLGIDEEDCTDIAILQKHQRQTSERRTMGEQKVQVNNAMYMIGIGAAIAGVIAFMTLRKRK